MFTRLVVAWVIMAMVSGGVLSEELNLKDIFSEPVCLLDASGKPLITGKAEATPFAADFDGDGKIDLIIGAKLNMDTAEGGIWLVKNVGTNEKQLYDWTNAWQVALSGGDEKKTSGMTFQCGCKSAGYVPVQAVDWNGDGWMDIVCSDTYARAFILINKKTSRDKPTFEQVKYFDFEKTNHGMMIGGGDWDGDSIRDFLYMPFAGATYNVFKGDILGGKGLHFLEGGLKTAKVIPMTGEKALECAWAWNFSGKAAPGTIEYVGVSNADKSDVEFYRAVNSVSKKIGVIGQFESTYVKLAASDANGDGKMDVLYSGGVFADPAKCKIWVIYGKVKNIPDAKPDSKTKPSGKPKPSQNTK